MKTNHHHENGSRTFADHGAVLVVVLLVMTVLLALGMTGLFLTSGSIQMNTNINMRNQALLVAEAGIERARSIVNYPAWTPPIPDLLAGTNSPSDEVPVNTSQCQGQARGAVLLDQLQASAPCTNTPCLLQNVVYPSLDRRTELPTSAGAVRSASLGTYTVYIRQDLADCRMGNFKCEQAPGTTGATSDAGATGGAGGSAGHITCTPDPGLPTPNGAFVIRSEGVAVDGRTRVVLEVTMSAGQGAQQAYNTPVSALCSAGINGCDDNSSVNNGIVVNSNATQTTPPSLGGAGGTTGTGGSVGTGGAGGVGGATTSPGSSVGGSSGGSGGSGTGGLTGSGGRGSGGSTTCPNGSCAKIAIVGVPGIWDPGTNSSDPNSGWAKFQAWLGTHSDNCQNPTTIDIDSTRLDKAGLLSKYNVLIMLDMYHSKAERTACISTSNYGNCTAQKCYRTDGTPGLCTGMSATSTDTATSTEVSVVSGCPKSVSFVATLTRTSTASGTRTGTVVATVGTSTVTGTATYLLTATGTGVTTATATANCSYPSITAGDHYPTTPSYLTSYNYGSARILDSSELSAIEAWVKQGNGIATTSSYFYQAPEVTNINNILSRFNLRYRTTGDPAGHIYTALEGNNGGGTDIGKVSASINDFIPGAPPFNFKSTVNLLQMRSGVILKQVTGGIGSVHLAAQVANNCPIGNTNYGNGNCTFSQASCTALGTPLDVGYYVDSIGPGGGHVVAWADEWLTYDTVWNTLNSCGNQQYQPDRYWENVVRYLGNCGP